MYAAAYAGLLITTLALLFAAIESGNPVITLISVLLLFPLGALAAREIAEEYRWDGTFPYP